MTAKEQAVQDIQNELNKQGKCFIAFRTELDPIMESLERNQIEEQNSLFKEDPFIKGHSQLMATCLFCKTGIVYENYTHYYENK